MTRTQEGTLMEQRFRWLRENRGTLRRIAEHLGVSHGKVRNAYFGFTQAIDPTVALALTKVGAPGFDSNSNQTAA